MATRDSIGSGGKIERAIFFLAGCLMGALGALLAWFSYKWAVSSIHFEYQWVWSVVTGGLAFFMLRGAWFTVMPQKKDRKFDLETSR